MFPNGYAFLVRGNVAAGLRVSSGKGNSAELSTPRNRPRPLIQGFNVDAIFDFTWIYRDLVHLKGRYDET